MRAAKTCAMPIFDWLPRFDLPIGVTRSAFSVHERLIKQANPHSNRQDRALRHAREHAVDILVRRSCS